VVTDKNFRNERLLATGGCLEKAVVIGRWQNLATSYNSVNLVPIPSED